MFVVNLTAEDGFEAWLGVDGLAHAAPTPHGDQALFATAEEAVAAPIPVGWVRIVSVADDWTASRIREMRTNE